ncbi:MAG: FAD-dependent oxidoreductase [Terracidiphilus sp.]|jgi:flavin-dependent dehydrogenase/SAM-dependent methyltransferase
MPHNTPDFRYRAQLTERMDEPCSRDQLRACLRDIARTNRWTMAYRPLLHWLDNLTTDLPPLVESLRILDVGSGYGDGLRRIEQWAKARGIAVELTGLDLNPDATAIAAEASPAASKIQWVSANVFAYKPPKPVDLVVSSLFTHHLGDDDIVRFLRWMEVHAEIGWFINDLSRAAIPYHVFRVFSKLIGLHPFVQYDGPVSVARSFVREDWQAMCAAAGLGTRDTLIESFRPARLCVARRKPAGPIVSAIKEGAVVIAPRQVDHLVIGGGLAGSMVAIRLAAAGRRVTLFERERAAHHKVCGEFLSPEAVEYVRQAGVEPLDLGAATIRFLRLSSKRRVVEAALPFTALSLSRYALDESLLSRAAESGCNVERGVFVEKLAMHGQMAIAQLRGGESLSARTVFLASGKHDLRGWERSAGNQADFIGFKLHWQLTVAQTESLRELMEIFLFPGGYGGLSLVEGDAANLCLVVRRAVLRKKAGWTGLLTGILDENRLLRQRLHGAKALWERPLAISPIPYGYLAAGSSILWRVGDQAAVIPSFTGDGMSIALHSAALAARMYLAGESVDEYHRALGAQLSRGMSVATWVSRAMVTTAGRELTPFALSLFPNAMQWIAASTRIPGQAIVKPTPLQLTELPGYAIQRE